MTKEKEVALHIALSDPVTTPKSCTLLVTELIKYIICQQRMIPYPYETLEYFVAKRKNLDRHKDECDVKRILGCIESERYFQQTSEALTTIASFLEDLLPGEPKHLHSIFIFLCESGQYVTRSQNTRALEIPHDRTLAYSVSFHVRVAHLWNALPVTMRDAEITLDILSAKRQLSEVALLFGSTPGNPRLVFQIILPHLTFGHSDSHHSTRKPLDDLLKVMLVSDRLNKVFSDDKSATTKMYVLLKMKSTSEYNDDSYILKENFCFPSKAARVTFTFDAFPAMEQCSCVVPYEDKSQENTPTHLKKANTLEDITHRTCNMRLKAHEQEIAAGPSNVSDDYVWYQNKLSLKAFRDGQMKGKSIVNFWVHPTSFV